MAIESFCFVRLELPVAGRLQEARYCTRDFYAGSRVVLLDRLAARQRDKQETNSRRVYRYETTTGDPPAFSVPYRNAARVITFQPGSPIGTMSTSFSCRVSPLLPTPRLPFTSISAPEMLHCSFEERAFDVKKKKKLIKKIEYNRRHIDDRSDERMVKYHSRQINFS